MILSDSAIVSLHWINERSLAYLTAKCEFPVIDTVYMTLIERFDFSRFKLVLRELRSSSRRSLTAARLGCLADPV